MELARIFKKTESMTVEEASEWLAGKSEGDVVVLDVRQPQEYRTGHLPGAVFIPLPELPDRADELDPATPVLAYCRSGNRSRAAAAFLSSEGFAAVFSLEGGITAWNGGVATGDYLQGMMLLKGRKTARELLSLAWVFEEGSRLFYKEALDVTSDPEAKNLFRQLVDAESRHKSTVLRSYRSLTGTEFSEDSLRREGLEGVMEGGVRVEDAISLLRDRGTTLQDIIETSMQLEVNALDLYIKMRREIVNAEAEKIYSSLIEEERRHLSMLGDLIGDKIERKDPAFRQRS